MLGSVGQQQLRYAFVTFSRGKCRKHKRKEGLSQIVMRNKTMACELVSGKQHKDVEIHQITHNTQTRRAQLAMIT